MLNRRTVVKWAAAGLLVAGAVLGGLPGLAQVAMAAEPTPVAAPDTARPERSKGGSDSYLAEALGITPEQLSAAKETARLAGIQQALDKGVITQAQADSLKNNERAGGRGGLSSFMKDVDTDMKDVDTDMKDVDTDMKDVDTDMKDVDTDMKDVDTDMKDVDTDNDALLAQALGISVEKLEQAQQQASDARTAAAVADGKMTQEQADMMKAKSALRDYLVEKNVYANAVAQAVKDGVITQAQADAILAQANGKDGFGKGDFGGRGGGRGGR